MRLSSLTRPLPMMRWVLALQHGIDRRERHTPASKYGLINILESVQLKATLPPLGEIEGGLEEEQTEPWNQILLVFSQHQATCAGCQTMK